MFRKLPSPSRMAAAKARLRPGRSGVKTKSGQTNRPSQTATRGPTMRTCSACSRPSPKGGVCGLDEHDQHHGQRRQTTGISQSPGPRGEPAQSFPGYDVRQHGVVEHRSEGDADIGDHHARQGERRRSDGRSGEPQQRRGNDADKRETHDPRFAAAADIGDGAQRRAQQGDDQPARADGIAPDRLAPDLVADDRDREIGREDKGDDQRGERRVRPIEQRPRELTDAIFLALANGAPGRGLKRSH